MKLVVTGASGYVGGRLLQRLSSNPAWQVVAASRAALHVAPGIETIRIDTADPLSLCGACEGAHVVVNLVSLAEPLAAASPTDALKVTAGAASAWAAAASAAEAATFIQVSTQKVYGKATGIVTEETPCAPLSPYAEAHLAAEAEARAHHGSVIVIRLGNGFGAPVGQSLDAWDLLLNNFCLQTVRDHAIVIRSSGLSWRNFVPMSNVVDGLIHAARGIPADTYNLGSSQTLTLRDAAGCVADVSKRLLGFAPPIVTSATGDEAPARLDFRSDRFAGTGFEPSTSFGQELETTLDAANALLSRTK